MPLLFLFSVCFFNIHEFAYCDYDCHICLCKLPLLTIFLVFLLRSLEVDVGDKEHALSKKNSGTSCFFYNIYNTFNFTVSVVANITTVNATLAYLALLFNYIKWS